MLLPLSVELQNQILSIEGSSGIIGLSAYEDKFHDFLEIEIQLYASSY